MSVKIDKNKRILTTLELFIEHNGNISDEELALKLSNLNIKSSSSTVGRDLTDNLKKLFIEENKHNIVNDKHLISNEFTNEQNSIIAFIKQKRKENKQTGRIKGGNNSSNRSK